MQKKKITKDNKKIRDHCHFTGKYRGAPHNKRNMNYKITRDIPVIFHNGSTYDYHFIIKELVKEFEAEFEGFGENTLKIFYKYMLKNILLFLYQLIKRITKKDMVSNDKIVNIPSKLKLIDSYRFMLDLCLLHYQVLLIIFQMDYINVKFVTLALSI